LYNSLNVIDLIFYRW